MASLSTFVAWRYLLARTPRVSRIAIWLAVVAVAAVGVTLVLDRPSVVKWWASKRHLDSYGQLAYLQTISVARRIALALLFLAVFFGALRWRFTFFTTVPIGGVWIGTGALVCVLSVMSGFESDLRSKILGSNAHLQITKEDGGDVTEWRELRAKIDAIPGVVASTPYATSEVVISANSNGQNVIIKGIDPKTVGPVTDLVADLDDPKGMQRLLPLAEDPADKTPAPVPVPVPGRDVVDPAPPDMPSGTDPTDFSGQADAGAGEGDGGSGAAEVVDPAPPDLVAGAVPDPIDYSQPDSALGALHDLEVATAADDANRAPSRLDLLPGVLVGRELVKQTHMYTGQEVRLVSPLSDPSNPDATGTPIPFNRDYRIAGIFFTGMYEYDLKFVYVTLDSLQDFLDRGDAVDGIEVRIHDADDTDHYVAAIGKELGPAYRVQDWKELNHSLFSALKLEKIAMFLVLGIVILVASFAIVGNLVMVVVEKVREIALLKTLGASDGSIIRLFVFQGLFIGLVGTLLGVGCGLLACVAGKQFGLSINPDVYYIDKLPIHVDPMSVAMIGAAGIVISMAATLYPAYLASRVRPAEGLRH